MLELITQERINRGVQRLLQAPGDLADCIGVQCPVHSATTGTEQHRDLFAEYAEILSTVATISLQWWTETLTAHKRVSNDKSEDEILREAWLSRPAGPAAFPGIVALVRDYWLACADINADLPREQRVAPEILLLAWLLDKNYIDGVKVLSCMPYWPVGLDKEGFWV